MLEKKQPYSRTYQLIKKKDPDAERGGIDFLKSCRCLMTELVLEQKFPDSPTNGLSKIPALFSSVPQLLLRHD